MGFEQFLALFGECLDTSLGDVQVAFGFSAALADLPLKQFTKCKN